MNATTNSNVKAFLQMIRKCEGTAGPDGYRTTYGYSYFKNMADHPAITGEWKGATLTDSQCKNAGFGPGCVSTAAGAYQFIKPTWLSAKKALGLKDFSEASQDAAAVWKLEQIGVLNLVIAGNITEALKSEKLGATWASLPTAKTKQNPKSQATALGYYKAAGGNIA